MKTLFTLMIAMLCSFAYAGNEPATSTLSLDGEYIAKRNVKCEVFTLCADSTAEFVSKSRSLRYFTLKLETGLPYMIKFTAASGEVKYLYIPNATPGEFIFDVDFNTTNCAVLKLNRAGKLALHPRQTKDIPITYVECK